ncbi:hypothetical protein Dimus_039574 [Dionaea muscipula]
MDHHIQIITAILSRYSPNLICANHAVKGFRDKPKRKHTYEMIISATLFFFIIVVDNKEMTSNTSPRCCRCLRVVSPPPCGCLQPPPCGYLQSPLLSRPRRRTSGRLPAAVRGYCCCSTCGCYSWWCWPPLVPAAAAGGVPVREGEDEGGRQSGGRGGELGFSRPNALLIFSLCLGLLEFCSHQLNLVASFYGGLKQ